MQWYENFFYTYTILNISKQVLLYVNQYGCAYILLSYCYQLLSIFIHTCWIWIFIYLIFFLKRTLEREVRKCQALIIWTDGDREGENIGFEIIECCQSG